MAGFIKVITGEMFSGKSQELARLVSESLANGMAAQVFYPAMASRGSDRDIDRRLQPHPSLTVQGVTNARAELLSSMIIDATQLVAIDEAQFFSEDIVSVVQDLRRKGKLVLIGGLDLDYLEHPFGQMGALMCVANEVVKYHAICAACGEQSAFISHRVSNESGQVAVGEQNYIPVCQDCYGALSHPNLEATVFVD